MIIPSEKQAIQNVSQYIAELIEFPLGDVILLAEKKLLYTTVNYRRCRPDSVIKIGSFTFVIEYKNNGRTTTVNQAIQQVEAFAAQYKKSVPVVVVPFMGKRGQELCASHKVSWIDLSGNCNIVASGLRIRIEGKLNNYKETGRPTSLFSPRSSRIIRWLLMNPSSFFTQRNLSKLTKTDEGYTSKIVRNLEQESLITRNKTRAVKVADPDLLLDAWLESYSFTQHQIIKGNIAARSGDETLYKLTAKLKDEATKYAVTALGGAWLMDHFANFRTVTVYLEEVPSPGLLQELSFRENNSGANVWLVVPQDDGVFHGSSIHDGINCVHPLQIYLDLKGHPERSKEAAEHLREQRLHWGHNDD